MEARLIQLLRLAIQGILDGGEPAGVVLSGGLDSSTVATLASEINPDIPVFTGFYDEPGFSELQYSRLVGTGRHHEILITPEDFVENFDGMVAAVRPPYQGMGTFGQYMVGKYIAEQTDVRVVLSGEGSDELFGGYPRLMAVAGHPLPDNYQAYRQPDGYPATLEEALQRDWDDLRHLLAVDDQCMAAHGLTAVAPFMDPWVVALAHALPPEVRVAKKFLRRAVRGLVPDAIIDRTDNMGFPIPLVAWAQRDPVRSFVADRIGYVPDAQEPWARGWWLDLITSSNRTAAAA